MESSYNWTFTDGGEDCPVAEPSMETLEAENVEVVSATLRGELTNMGGDSSVNVFFRWGERNQGLINSTSPQSLSSIGTFSETVSGLSGGTTYDFKAVGVNEGGEGKGEVESFTTITPVPPTVETIGADPLGGVTFLLKGEVIEHGREDVFEVGFDWSTTSGWYGNEKNKKSFAYTDDYFEAEVNLTPQTTYYFRAKARNDDGWSYGEEESFRVEVPGVGIIRIRWGDIEKDIQIEVEGRIFSE